jgi:hypothetical protein
MTQRRPVPAPDRNDRSTFERPDSSDNPGSGRSVPRYIAGEVARLRPYEGPTRQSRRPRVVDPARSGTYKRLDHAEHQSPRASRYHRWETLRHRVRVPAIPDGWTATMRSLTVASRSAARQRVGPGLGPNGGAQPCTPTTALADESRSRQLERIAMHTSTSMVRKRSRVRFSQEARSNLSE